MAGNHIFEADEIHDKLRVDKVLPLFLPKLSRSQAQKLIESGKVLLNDKLALKSSLVKRGDVVELILEEKKQTLPMAENIPLTILYEDDDLLVVNKEKGMVVHAGAEHDFGTLVNALLYHTNGNLSHKSDPVRPGIVHRLDKDTSGLLVVAKNDKAHENLAEQIANHTAVRAYQTVVYGYMKDIKGVIDAPVARHPVNRTKMTVMEGGRRAVTRYELVKQFKEFAHLTCTLETGRTHQIRVHLAHINHPIAGDSVYGPKKALKFLRGQCLHAYKLNFIHPTSSKAMLFETDLPDYFINYIGKIDS